MSKKKFLDFHDGITSQRPFLMYVGARNLGKSYQVKDWMIRDYFKNNHQFCYSRRFKDDNELTAPDYFNDVLDNFKKIKTFEYRKIGKLDCYIINGNLAGYSIAVNQYTKMKSVSWPDLYNIVFDEFIPENGRYIGGKFAAKREPELCFNFFQSVARKKGEPYKKGVRFFLLSNSVSEDNPYYQYFNIDERIRHGAKKIIERGLYFEQPSSEDYEVIDILRESDFGDLIAGTKYGSYALDNDYYLDNNNFILDSKEEIPKDKEFIFNIVFGIKKFGVYFCKNDGLYYVINKYNKGSSLNYALSNDGHTINTILVEKSKNKESVKLLRDAYELGFVRFQTLECKNILTGFLGITI